MRQVLLETANPNDLTPQELHRLAREMEEGADGVKVDVAYEEQLGAGVTFIDVLHFWLPDAEFFRDLAYDYLIIKATEFMQARRQRKHASGRPISIVVHAPDGTVITVINDPPQETDRPSDDPPRPRPSVRPAPTPDEQG